jgi:hypothetical protein
MPYELPQQPALPEEITRVESKVLVGEIQKSAKLITATVPVKFDTTHGILGDDFWGGFASRDFLRLHVEGDVVAGVDLERLSVANVYQGEGEVVITLPPSEVLFSRLDNEKTYVSLRRLAFWKWMTGTQDIQLEGRARSAAEKILRARLCRQALQEAADGAKEKFQPVLERVMEASQDVRSVRLVAPVGGC